MMAFCSSDDPDAAKKMRGMFGPQQVDQQIRQAISMCWMMLPKEKKNPDAYRQQLDIFPDAAGGA